MNDMFFSGFDRRAAAGREQKRNQEEENTRPHRNLRGNPFCRLHCITRGGSRRRLADPAFALAGRC
jgi:hypothetical protein